MLPSLKPRRSEDVLPVDLESKEGANQQTRGWPVLNLNLMVREKSTTISQLFKFSAPGVTNDVLEA